MSEERGFQVTDRRRVRPDAPGPGEPEPAVAAGGSGPEEPEPPREESSPGPAAAGGPPEPEARAEEGEVAAGAFGVLDLVRMTIGMLDEKAWISMGLLANPLTGQIERDLDEARRAIDVLTSLAQHLEPEVSAAEKRELQVMLSNLRLNYVRQSQGS